MTAAELLELIRAVRSPEQLKADRIHMVTIVSGPDGTFELAASMPDVEGFLVDVLAGLRGQN